MKHSGFTFVETFPVIAHAIVKSSNRDAEGFFSHHEIVNSLLRDDKGKKLVEEALKHSPPEQSPKAKAGNMVAWFSKIWTETKGKDSVWEGLFEKFERSKDRPFRYKLRLGLSEQEATEEIIREGARVRVFANRYERDPRARAKCIEKYGTDCSVCGFSFRETYGPEADGIVYVHHLQPLAEIGEEHEVDPVKDLRPVCPNCHAVLHWRTPAFSIEEVKAFLSKAKQNPPTFTLAPSE
jgi:hypothetical protein